MKTYAELMKLIMDTAYSTSKGFEAYATHMEQRSNSCYVR